MTLNHALRTPQVYQKSESTWVKPNAWDVLALSILFGFLALLALGARDMLSPYRLGQPIIISLYPVYLPYYAFRSVLRMGLALLCSLGFTLVIGTIAAKSRHAHRLIIPLIDIFQSVPVLGYLSITVVGFISLFPNSMMGPECAAIFAIFTAQVWNMVLSFYQSLRTLPHELKEAAHMFHLNAWQIFWKLDVPFAMPGLIWNAMMSMSASWFFVVASEAITVNQQHITLPGIGSYIALAVQQANIQAVFYAIFTMFVVILIYDQLLFRPLNNWIQQFQFEPNDDEDSTHPWIVQLFRRTRWLNTIPKAFFYAWDLFVNLPTRLIRKRRIPTDLPVHHRNASDGSIAWTLFLTLLLIGCCALLTRFVFASVNTHETLHVLYLGSITALRVLILIVLSSLIWTPISVWIGMRPSIAQRVQPILQFLSSFPVNLFYPVAVLLIFKFNLNANIWTSPLMILGSQWYIAFNVISGTMMLPKELRQTAALFKVRGFLWWKRLVLPGIFPYYVTGAITASGGAWNASIIAEVVSWGDKHIQATGLGAYITQQATLGDFPRLALGVSIMCVYVVVINRLIWRPLYNLAAERFR